jgi:hypothetical protein
MSSSPSSPGAEDRIEGLGGLLSLVGVVPARARFVGSAVAWSVLASTTVGLSLGALGAAFLPTGPVLPFLVGSWLGNTLGLYQYYRSSKREALRLARNYPSILAHALWTEWGVVVPDGVVAGTEERCRRHRGRVDSAASDLDLEATKGGGGEKKKGGAVAVALDRWIEGGGPRMVGLAILAAPRCGEDVEEIQRREREALVESHRERTGGPSEAAAE